MPPGGANDIVAFGLQEIAKYWTMPRWSMSRIEMNVNLDLWEALPDDLKDMLQTAFRAFDVDCRTLIAYENAIWNDKFVEEYGIDILWWPDEDWEAAKAVAMDLLAEREAVRDPYVVRYIAILKDFMRELGLLD